MNKITYFWLLIIAIFSANDTFAQMKSNYKCIYSLDMMKDTVEHSYFRSENYVLQMSDGFTKGFTYNNFYADSLRTHDSKRFRELITEILNQALQTKDFSIIGNNHLSEGNFQSYIHKNYNKAEMYVIEQIADNDFVYSDELKPQQWEIHNDTMTVLGYLSQKASCNFRGREFVAWFTTEIPISEGPWKFYGYPG